MSKQLHTMKLIGCLDDGSTAKTHQADDVADFCTQYGKHTVVQLKNSECPDFIKLTTDKGEYRLPKHETQNYYHGVCNGTKVQVSLKKVVGELRAWY